jgi:cell division protein FtsI/penicillin-binding protein 2
MDASTDLTKFAKEYAAMGVAPCGLAGGPAARPAGRTARERETRETPARAAGERCYPLGGGAFHLLGDAVTRANWAAPNAAFAERDFDARLRGYADVSELAALWDHRDAPYHPAVRAILDRPRDIQLTIDARLQVRVAALLAKQLGTLGLAKGAIVVLDVATGDVLASVSAPWPSLDRGRAGLEGALTDPDLPLLDRARYGQYPPGSTFKLVTAAAALRASSGVAERHFGCRDLPEGRVGVQIPGWRRPVRDDVTDRVAHGDVALDEGLRVSCNAYFAQLGLAVGPATLKNTADAFELTTSRAGTVEGVKGNLPWASYGQAEVLASPFRMARVAATMAAHGDMPVGRWVIAPAQPDAASRRVLDPAAADRIARAMRSVVTGGTASALAGHAIEIAGKTGTAEVAGAASHSWFVGFAPAAGTKRIAVAVIVENGGYGARAAVPLAGEVVSAARSLSIIPDIH